MSWLFSQALVAAYSEANSSAGQPCAPSSAIPTPQAYLPPDKMTDFSHLSQYGMTFAPLTADLGEGLLKWLQAAFRARTCQPRRQSITESLGLKENAAACGVSSPESLAKYDLDTHSLRTARCLFPEDSTGCCVTLPRWGTMRAGELSEQTPPAWITNANGSGLLPTVLASDWRGGTTTIRKDTGKQRLDQWRHYVKVRYGLTYPHPTHSELRMGWPEGWTELKPLGTDKFQAWCGLHGKL